MGVISRPVRAGAVAAMGLAITAFTGTLASAGAATPAPGASLGYVALANSVSPTTDNVTGSYSSSKMQVEVAVAPRDAAGLNSMLAALYDKNSPSYHHFLTSGQFDARYAPTPANRDAVAKFLNSSGLTVVPSGSPFLVRATGSSAKVQSTFHTTLNTFKDPQGTKYFANSTPVYVPSSLAGASLGVIGLTNTVRDAQHARPALQQHDAPGREGVVGDQLRDALSHHPAAVRHHRRRDQLPLGYGAGPGCSGLTPSQDNSLYGAPNARRAGQGQGRRHRGVRALGLPALRHRHLGAPVLRASLQPAAGRRERRRRPAEPGVPDRRPVPAEVRGLLRRHRGRRGHRDAAGHRARRQPPHRLQRAERLHRPDRARRVVRDRQGQRGRLGQLQLGRLRERRQRRLRPGREHHLPADGRAGAERVRGRR